MGVLYVVGTPLGNLEDLTPRAARVLGSVGLIAAEDTRRTGQLLRHLGIRAPLTSYHEHNRRAKEAELLRALETGDVALVTDGGMPGISDPGADIVAAAARAGHRVSAVPGPSAVVAALAVSGFPADSFLFLGFLERQGRARRAALARIGQEPASVVIYEAPHRLRKTLTDLAAQLAERPICVCRELTKLHEETFRGTAADALQHFQEPRGEITIVIGPAAAPEQPPDVSVLAAKPGAASLVSAARAHRAAGLSAKETAARLAEQFGVSRKAAYQQVLAMEAE